MAVARSLDTGVVHVQMDRQVTKYLRDDSGRIIAPVPVSLPGQVQVPHHDTVPARRYVVVRVDKYLGDYTGRYLAWSVADRLQANRCVTDKYDSQAVAQTEADRLEAEVHS